MDLFGCFLGSVTSHRQTVVLGLIARWRPSQCYGPSAETYCHAADSSVFEYLSGGDRLILDVPKCVDCCVQGELVHWDLSTRVVL
jgi:hypothetical protein